MLRHIQTGDLLLRGSAESEDRPDDRKRDGDRDCSKGCCGNHPEELYPEQFKSAAVEESQQFLSFRIRKGIPGHRIRGEQPYCNGAPDAVHTVDCHRSHRIIHAEHIVEEPYPEDHQDAGHSADDDGTKAVYGIAGCRNCHQTGQGSVQAHGNIRLSVTDPGEDHAHHRSHRRRHGRDQKDRPELRQACGCRAVEAVPAEPENKDAQSAQRDVVARKRVDLDDLSILVLRELSDPRSQHGGADQGADAADHVDAVGSREIMEADL